MNAQYYFDTGMSFIEKGKYKEALSCFEESVKLQPDFADANFGIGVCKIKLGDTVNGEATILRAARLGNIDAQSYFEGRHDAANKTTHSSNIASVDNHHSNTNSYTSCENEHATDFALTSDQDTNDCLIKIQTLKLLLIAYSICLLFSIFVTKQAGIGITRHQTNLYASTFGFITGAMCFLFCISFLIGHFFIKNRKNLNDISIIVSALIAALIL